MHSFHIKKGNSEMGENSRIVPGYTHRTCIFQLYDGISSVSVVILYAQAQPRFWCVFI